MCLCGIRMQKPATLREFKSVRLFHQQMLLCHNQTAAILQTRESVCVRLLLCVSAGCNEQLGRCGLSQITPHSIILSDVANESAAVNMSNDLGGEILRPSPRSCLYVCCPISLAINHVSCKSAEAQVMNT